LPILKRNIHQQKLQEVATSGNPKFFLGTDSAPHARGAKESACGCAGCFSAFAAIELYAEIFDDIGALDKLEGFASHFGADFYNLPINSDTLTLNKEDWPVPTEMPFAGDVIVPIKAGEVIRWQVAK
jgi:dihydroorotase